VDFLALLADRTAAARVVSAPSQGPSVEPVLELIPVLRFPRLDGETVLLLDLVAIHSGITLNEQKGMILRSGVR